MTVLAVLFGTVVFLAVLPLIAEAFRVPVTRRLQVRAAGHMADLTLGATHYKWTGKADAPIAVCIHGLSTPSYIFAATEHSLNAIATRE